MYIFEIMQSTKCETEDLEYKKTLSPIVGTHEGECKQQEGIKNIFTPNQDPGVQVLIHYERMYCFQLSYCKDFFIFSLFLFLKQIFKFPHSIPNCSFQSNWFGMYACSYVLFTVLCG